MPRYKVIPVSIHLVFHMMRGEHPAYKTILPLPDDAKLINVRHTWPHSIELLVESESFEEVVEGSEIPYFVPTFERKVSDSRLDA